MDFGGYEGKEFDGENRVGRCRTERHPIDKGIHCWQIARVECRLKVQELIPRLLLTVCWYPTKESFTSTQPCKSPDAEMWAEDKVLLLGKTWTQVLCLYLLGSSCSTNVLYYSEPGLRICKCMDHSNHGAFFVFQQGKNINQWEANPL